MDFCELDKRAIDSEYLKVGKEIKKSPWWPKFYSHRQQNDTSCNQIGQAIWAVGGAAIDFGPSSSYISILSVMINLVHSKQEQNRETQRQREIA